MATKYTEQHYLLEKTTC